MISSSLLLSSALVYFLYLTFISPPCPAILAEPWTPPPGGLPHLAPNSRLAKARLVFKNQVLGPESLVSDHSTGFMFTSTLDGRIMGLDVATNTTWTAHRFNSSCPDIPSTTPYLSAAGPREAVCGRPLGMRIDHRDGSLLVLESYTGLYRFASLPSQLHQALPAPTLLTRGPQGGRTIVFANDLAVTSKGVVYFTDSMDRWGRFRIVFDFLSARPSGRLLEHNLVTGQTRVLHDKLRLPNGVSLSDDEKQVYFASWLSVYAHDIATGELRVVMDNLPGIPDNLRVHPTKRNHFLLCMASLRAQPFSLPDFLAPYPLVREWMVAMLPETMAAWLFERFVKRIGLVLELDLTHNTIAGSWQDRSGRIMWLSEAHLHSNKHMYFGSWHENHLVEMSLEEFLSEDAQASSVS